MESMNENQLCCQEPTCRLVDHLKHREDVIELVIKPYKKLLLKTDENSIEITGPAVILIVTD